MGNQFERFHAALGVESAAVGLAVAVTLMALSWPGRGRIDAVRRIAVASTAAVMTLVVWGYLSAGIGAVLVALLALVGADRRSDTPVAGVLAVISLGGVWAAVPDTEVPLVAAAVVTVVVAIASATARMLGPVAWQRGDRNTATVLVVVVAIIGSSGRTEVVGGVGCVGLLVGAVPPERPPRSPRWSSAAVAVGLHLVLVAVSSRLVTRLPTPMAIGATTVLVAVALAAGWCGIGTRPVANAVD